jgi:hypothetical protein
LIKVNNRIKKPDNIVENGENYAVASLKRMNTTASTDIHRDRDVVGMGVTHCVLRLQLIYISIEHSGSSMNLFTPALIPNTIMISSCIHVHSLRPIPITMVNEVNVPKITSGEY